MPTDMIHLKVLLPYQVFVENDAVSRIVAESTLGSFGILPHRRDCVASLVPGILVYETDGGEKNYAAVDRGVLVKTGLEVLISVRNAIAGEELDDLEEAVDKQFLALDEEEKHVRIATAKLEAGLLRRLSNLKNE